MHSQILSRSYISQAAKPREPIHWSDVNGIVMGTSLYSTNVYQTIGITGNYNTQFNDIFQKLSVLRDAAQQNLNIALADDPTTTTSRYQAVNLAWRYEKAEIEIGGSGTRDWSPDQKQEILDRKSVV